MAAFVKAVREMEIKKNWELSPAHFGPLWKYVEDDEITDIDFNGTDLWITNTSNERTKVSDHGVTKEFIEKFSHYVANNVSNLLIRWIICLKQIQRHFVSVLCMKHLPSLVEACASERRFQVSE